MKQYSCLGDYSETKAFLILFPKHDNIFNFKKAAWDKRNNLEEKHLTSRGLSFRATTRVRQAESPGRKSQGGTAVQALAGAGSIRD